MGNTILPNDLVQLRLLEKQLKSAQQSNCVQEAEKAMKAIQGLLAPYKDHHRLLECKLWYFETLLDANHTATAESGFHGVRSKAKKHTRLYIEATFFLAICYLRQKRIKEAKAALQEVLTELNKEKEAPTRQLLQKRIIERTEEESILAELIGVGHRVLKVEEVHRLAIELV